MHKLDSSFFFSGLVTGNAIAESIRLSRRAGNHYKYIGIVSAITVFIAYHFHIAHILYDESIDLENPSNFIIGVAIGAGAEHMRAMQPNQILLSMAYITSMIAFAIMMTRQESETSNSVKQTIQSLMTPLASVLPVVRDTLADIIADKMVNGNARQPNLTPQRPQALMLQPTNIGNKF
jgi:hypothetical protein